MTSSPLDKALLAVQAAADAEEGVINKAEDQYYDLFLNTTLFIPTWNEKKKSKVANDDEEISIQPVIVEDESGEENKTYVMIFDSEERLEQWADGQKVGVVELAGYDVLNILGSANYLLLNPSSECSKEFYPEEIEWLLTSIVEKD